MVTEHASASSGLSTNSAIAEEWPAGPLHPARRVATLVGDFDRSPAYAGLADALILLIGDGRIPSAPGCPASAS